MAKIALINRDSKRRKTVAKFAARRAQIIEILYDAKRSDDECSTFTEWAMPGFYHVEAAALAGEPTDVQFELVRPASEVITKTVTPKPQKGKNKQQDSTHQPGEDGEGNSAG